jgi:hypothetical protein
MIPSSKMFPAEQESIRSISPEIGWIGEEAAEGQNENGNGDQGSRLAKSTAQDGDDGAAEPVAASTARTLAVNRQSTFSVGEGGLLWGRLTSALEAQDGTTT